MSNCKYDTRLMGWKEFKQLAQEDSADWIYRGQGSEAWDLNSTLGRVTNTKTIYVKDCIARYNSFIETSPETQSFLTAQGLASCLENPFKIGLLYANDAHKDQFIKFFRTLILLRHYGFPSPLLDFTHDFFVAAFFALSSATQNTPIAIWRMKATPVFQPFDLQLYNSDFYFKMQDSRHDKQKSNYVLCIHHEHRDTVVAPDKRMGPILHLGRFNHLSAANIKLEKIIISDIHNHPTEVLKELSDNGYNHSTIYGCLDNFEATVHTDQYLEAFSECFAN